MIVQDAYATRIVRRLRRLLAGCGEIVVGERFESDENAGTACQGHVANQAWVVGDINRDRSAPGSSARDGVNKGFGVRARTHI